MNFLPAPFLANASYVFWVLVAIVMFQPAIKRAMLENGRRLILKNLERARGSRVISLIHRREVVNILGFPVVQYLDIEESESILRAIRLTAPEMPIDLILHTPAGLSLGSEQIARALSRHKGKVTVIVPHYAMSGGTLLALAADELIMSTDAILGALDPTVGAYPAASILSVSKSKEPADMDDETYLLVDNAWKAVRQMKSVVERLLQKRLGEAEAERLGKVLTSGKWTQDYPISVEEARELGLAINTEVPLLVFQYMNLFHQAQQRRPSVDFNPISYEREQKHA